MDGDSGEPADRRTGTGTRIRVWIWIAAASGVAGHVLFLWRASSDESADPYTPAYYWPLIPIAGLGVAAIVLGVVLAAKSSGSIRQIVVAILGSAIGAAVTCLALWGLWVFGVDQPLVD